MLGKIVILGMVAFMIGLTGGSIMLLNRESTPTSRAEAQVIQSCSSPGAIVVNTGKCPMGYVDNGAVQNGGGDQIGTVLCCIPIPVTPTDTIPTATPEPPTATPESPSSTPTPSEGPTATPQACFAPQPTLIMECSGDCQKLTGESQQ